MRSALRKVGSLLFAIVIVSSMVGGPVGTAQAVNSESLECTATDVALAAIMPATAAADTCEVLFGDSERQADAYAASVGMRDRNDRFVQTQKNMMDERRTAAWTEAKISVVNSLNNNVSEANASRKANRAIWNYYQPHIENSIYQYDSTMRNVEHIWKQDNSFVTPMRNEETLRGFATVRIMVDNGTENNSEEYIEFRTAVTEDENNNVRVLVPKFVETLGDEFGYTQHDLDANENNEKIKFTNKSDSVGDVGFTGTSDMYFPVVVGPDGNESSPIPTSEYEHNSQFFSTGTSGFVGSAQNLQAQTDTYVSEVYSSYDAGEIDPSDLLNPTDLASRAATEYNSTGSNSYVALALAAQGLQTDTNTSVTVSYNNSTVEGTLAYTGDESINWQVGETYNTSNLNGTVYLAVQGENGSSIETIEEQEFTIESAQNPQTGDAVESVSTQDYTDSSTNTSKLQEELERMEELTNRYEQLQLQFNPPEPPAVPNPGSGLPSGERLIAAIAIGGVVLFALRES